MSQRIEVELDDQGRLVVPHSLQKKLGLYAGATVIVENETLDAAFVRLQPIQPQILNKEGILVVQAEAVGNISEVVSSERERRIENIAKQVSQ